MKLTRLILAVALCLLLAGAASAQYGEAPMLEELVEAGELPPVEDRLPVEPRVIETVEEIGTYGGTLEEVTVGEPGGPGDFAGPIRAEADIATLKPNYLRDYELSEDATKMTLYLREGLKYSDGEPFTARDIEFFYNDVLNNELIYPGGVGDWRGRVEIEVVTDYEVIMHLESPYPNAPRDLAREWGNQARFHLPKHFMKQFHGDYGDLDQLEEWVEAADGVDHWYELEIWDAEWGDYHEVRCPEGEFMPVLDPFMVTEITTEYAIYERNPYYWAVDPEGNQLPYIDEVYVRSVTDSEVQQAQIMSGEVDYAEGIFENYPLYVDFADEEGYRVYVYEDLRGSHIAFQFNQTYDQDPYIGELLADPLFRRAMSLAIDREEINDMIFLGQGEPRQASLTPASRFYNEEYTQAYAEYDPDKASHLLDELGLDERDSEGYRLRPDTGERLRLEHITGFDSPEMIGIFELCNEYWREVGVEVSLELHGGERLAWAADNEVQIWSWLLDKGTDVFVPYTEAGMGFYIPLIWSPGWNVESVWGTEWARWYQTDGEEGEEPPAEYMELIDTYREILRTTDEEELEELVDQVFAFQAENLVQIGVVGLTPTPIIVRDRLRNVPEEGYSGWDAFFCYPYRREQWFIE